MMQDKFVELTNEAINVNTTIFGKALDIGIDSGKNFADSISTQTDQLINATKYEDYVTLQKDWVENAVGRSVKFGQDVSELGVEAGNAYFAIWQNYFNTVQQPLNVVAAVAPKTNSKPKQA